jgi:CRISPR system Cascade subunit CasC
MSSHYLQGHILTAYPASNLNRDDNGRPKTLVYGGEPRIRISSQSLKRAWRTSAVFETAVNGHTGVRTQTAGRVIYKQLIARGATEEQATRIARYIAMAVGKINTSGKGDPLFTRQLVFLSADEEANALRIAEELLSGDKEIPKEWQKYLDAGAPEDEDEALVAEEDANEAGVPEDEGGAPLAEEDADEAAPVKAKKTAKVVQKPNKHPLTEEILHTADHATDIAMFGRMLADTPTFNREAAVQVSHAFTTHRAAVEDDYYVAVDDRRDLSAASGAGSSFVDVAEYGSGLFYTYICIDLKLLLANLKGNVDLAKSAVSALLEAASTVSPKGKQASYASRARASYVLIEAGDEQPRSLAGAFIRPVRAEASADVVQSSVAKLEGFRDGLDQAYGACAANSERMLVLPEGHEGASLAELKAFAERALG